MLTGQNIASIMRAVATVTKEQIAAAVAEQRIAMMEALVKEVSALEQRLIIAEQRSLTPGPAGAEGPLGPIGESGRVGEKGDPGVAGDRGPDGVPGPIGLMGPIGEPGPVGEKGDPGVAGARGSDGAPGLIGLAGHDGARGSDGQDGVPGVAGQTGADGTPGPMGGIGLSGKDGVGLTGAVIGQDGQLVLTLSDGSVKAVGYVVGKDASLPDVLRLVVDEVAKMPTPKDGIDGLHGKDGTNGVAFTLRDVVSIERTGDREVTHTYRHGEAVQSFVVPDAATMIYRGVYIDGKAYEAGDTVTWAGSTWVALRASTTKPGSGDAAKDWTMCVKRGNDAKGSPGAKGDQGPRGPQGDRGPERWA